MTVKDPRMKNLIKNEKLRGIGAYWFIMEKLGMSPNQRAELAELRPFCNQDIPFRYLKKIVCEYQLFTFDSEGFFTPVELNPPLKKEKRATKNAQKSMKFQPKNSENSQKAANIQANPCKNEFGNLLNNGDLAENDLTNKENIKDIITTTATEEKEGTAAAIATASKSSPESPAFSPAVSEFSPVVSVFSPAVSVSSDSSAAAVSPEPSAGGGQQPPLPPQTTITACDDSGLPERPLHPVRPWQELADGLLNESSAWLDIAYLRSGYGILLRRHLKQAVEIFKTHILAYGKGEDMLEMRDIQRYFINFVNAGSRTSKALHEALTAIDAKDSSDHQPADDEPYRYEQLINGQRSYQGCPIPKNAPPRPDETASWDNEQQCWITGKKPPRRKR